MRFVPNNRHINIAMAFHLFNPLTRPDGVTPRYMANQYFWQVGRDGFRVKDLIKRFWTRSDVLSVYCNCDWLCSQSFVLRSKANPMSQRAEVG